jgi:hypothetical protein
MNTTRADEQRRGTRLRALALVSSDESTGDRDRPDRGRVKILRAADAFDRRDHVMSAAAYQLHVKAMASSAALDHPGFVPDELLPSFTGEDLHSPGADPVILATELCTADMWRRTDGGYRVLDWPAVQACIDHVRELRTVDKRAPARKREHHVVNFGHQEPRDGPEPVGPFVRVAEQSATDSSDGQDQKLLRDRP